MSEISDMTEDESSILFTHKLLPVQTAIKVWPQENFQNSTQALYKTLEKLSATGEISTAKWRNRECAVSKITISEKALAHKISAAIKSLGFKSQTHEEPASGTNP